MVNAYVGKTLHRKTPTSKKPYVGKTLQSKKQGKKQVLKEGLSIITKVVKLDSVSFLSNPKELKGNSGQLL
jgi:hypothetical protein